MRAGGKHREGWGEVLGMVLGSVRMLGVGGTRSWNHRDAMDAENRPEGREGAEVTAGRVGRKRR